LRYNSHPQVVLGTQLNTTHTREVWCRQQNEEGHPPKQPHDEYKKETRTPDRRPTGWRGEREVMREGIPRDCEVSAGNGIKMKIQMVLEC